MISKSYTLSKTRSGKSFSPWDGHPIRANGDFDLVSQLKNSISSHDAWLELDDLDDYDYGLLHSMSPLTSADSSPRPSSPVDPSHELHEQYHGLPCSMPPLTPADISPRPSSPMDRPPAPPADIPSQTYQSSETANSSPSDPRPQTDSPASKKCRKAQSKAQSKANKKKKKLAQQAAVFSHHAARPEVIEKYVNAKNAIQTVVTAQAAPVASSAYVALDDRQRTKKMPSLEDLVGEGSKYKFTLVKAGDG